MEISFEEKQSLLEFSALLFLVSSQKIYVYFIFCIVHEIHSEANYFSRVFKFLADKL